MTAADTPPGLLAQVRRLAGHSLTYGLADVLPNAINFALLPFYTRRLTPADYGALALLAFLGAPLKILFRLGLDSGFFRIHYECKTVEAQRQLAGTVALFSAAFTTVLFSVTAIHAGDVAHLLSTHDDIPARWVRLTVADLYLGSFALVPQALLRIQGRPRTFTGLALGRQGAATVFKVALLLGGFGLDGVLWSDLLSTTAYVLAQMPVLLGNAAPAFSRSLLRDTLHFGAPKVPHGMLVHAQNLADRRILVQFVDVSSLGVYQVGYTLGQAVKVPISAFEQAWQPFVYSQIQQPDAPRTLARVGTYFFAIFTAFGLAAAMMGREALVIMTRPQYLAASTLVPVVVLAYVIHGFFLLTSVGIGVAKQARYYPLITLAAATTNIVGNFALIPRAGLLGAAWATVLSYAVMAALGLTVSQRLYPLPVEWSRYARIAVAAAATYALSLLAPAPLLPAIAVKTALLAAFPAMLWLLRFWTPAELAQLRRQLQRRPGEA